MSVIDDFSQALRRDTPLAAMAKPFRNLPRPGTVAPEDQAAYDAMTAAGLPAGPSSMPGQPAVMQPTNTATRPFAIPLSGLSVSPSAEHGISKISTPGAAPLYSNLPTMDALSGIDGKKAGGMATPTAEGMDRQAKEIQIKQSMIDAQPMGGVAILPDQNEALNAERTARWRQDDLLSKAKYGNPAAGQLAVELGRGQSMQTVAGMQQNTAQQGQQFEAADRAARNQLAMRGQDIGAKENAARFGLDESRLKIQQADAQRAGDKWGIEQGILKGQAEDSAAVRAARSGLTKAIESGDPQEINAAKMRAIAAGVQFPKSDANYTVEASPTGAGGYLVIDKASGKGQMIDTKGNSTPIAPPGGMQAAQTANLPPAKDRVVGQTYNLPTGKAIWRDGGWEQVQ